MALLPGSLLGNVITFSGSGMLCAYGFDNGWGSIFYVTGRIEINLLKPGCEDRVEEVTGLLFCCLFLFFVVVFCFSFVFFFFWGGG